jgi:DNA-binding NarL/FixJ family response regulator
VPPGLRATAIAIGNAELVVLSFPVERADLRAARSLTSAEAAVAELAIAGLSNAQIAERRGTSVRTVANQMASILRKLGCDSREQLAVRHARNELDPAHRQAGAHRARPAG